MSKNIYAFLMGVSVLPVMLMMPASAIGLTGRDVVPVGESREYDSASVSNVTEYDAGGAINSLGSVSIVGNTASFSRNSAHKGGAIYLALDENYETPNTGTLSISGQSETSAVMSTFSRNKATGTDENMGQGGAIYIDPNQSLNISNAYTVEFDKNESAIAGGAIYNQGTVNINAVNVNFTMNNSNSTSVTTTSSMGGAIFNIGEMNILGTNNVFSENRTRAYDAESIENGGGAINNRGLGNSSVLTIGKSDLSSINTFNNNRTAQQGGAIYAYAIDGVGNNSNVVINGTENTFEWNSAATNGGAISNNVASVNSTHGAANFTINGDTCFENNGKEGGTNDFVVKTKNGGAIYNAGTFVLNGTSEFTGNASTDFGGAIYNAGVLTINGDATFNGNVAANVSNDIHNVGTLNIESGTTIIGGGVSGSAGALNIASGAVLDVGTTTLTQNSVTIDAGGRLVARLINPESFARLNVNSFGGDGTLALELSQIGTYDVFGLNAPSDGYDVEFADSGNHITVDSPVYNVVWSDDGRTVTASRKTAAEIATDNELSDVAGQTLFVLMNSEGALQTISTDVQHQLVLKNSAVAEQTLDAINPEIKSVSQSASVSMQNTVAKLAMGRMSVGIGRNGGDVKLTSGGVWAQGLYNKSKQNDAFNGYTRGVAFGVDGTVNSKWTLGAGYSYAHSDISATARDTEIDALAVFVYGQYKPSDWYVNAVLNYTSSDYSEVGDAAGIAVKSDYDVSSFGAVVMTGYELAAGFTPSIGLRYVHVATDDYKNSLDVANSFSDLNYLTAVFDTKYSHRFDVSKNWKLLPEFHYGVSFDMVSDAMVATVVIPGAEYGTYTLTGDRLSRLGAEFGLGIGAKYRDMDLSLNYDIEVREGYSSQTGRMKFRYNF